MVSKIGAKIKSAVCSAAKPLVLAAQANHQVVGYGVGGGAGFGIVAGLAGSLGIQVVADSTGDVGLAIPYSGNAGLGVAGVGYYGGFQMTSYTTAQTLSQFASPFGRQYSVGVSVGADGLGGALSASASPSSITVTTTLGTGGGPVAGFGALGTSTELGGTKIPLSTNCGPAQ